MPYVRPTLTALRAQVAQDIAVALPGSDPLLRFSNLAISGVAQANLANLHYGYLDWIASQAVPFTATNEFLEGWAALKKVFRKSAAAASGSVTFLGANGALIPAGSGVVRGDGVAGTTQADAIIYAGSALASVIINADPYGATGAFGNMAAGVVMTLTQSIAGVQASGTVSTAFTGGADIETDDSLRSRMLLAYQNTPQGGDQADYVTWAQTVSGVTRAWCSPNSFGAGTVVMYVMFDVSESASSGFPQGANGVAAGEPRAAAATGDQLAVANAILPLQPVTALVYVVAPVAAPVNFTISGIVVAKRAAAQAAIADAFFRLGNPKGGSTPVALIWSAIATVSGVVDFIISVPSGDIANAAGTLPTVGVITFI